MSLFNRKQCELPVGKPVRICWTLPASWTPKICDRFLAPAIKIVGCPSFTSIQRDDGSEIFCVEVAHVHIPGYLPGDLLENGQPAQNEYVTTLNRSEAVVMTALLHLLSQYGANVQWEASSETTSVLLSRSN